MKDSIKEKLGLCNSFDEVKNLIVDYIDYYNKERYQWQLAKLSPNEFYEFYTTGHYPLEIPNPPTVPVPNKNISEIGKQKINRDDIELSK